MFSIRPILLATVLLGAASCTKNNTEQGIFVGIAEPNKLAVTIDIGLTGDGLVSGSWEFAGNPAKGSLISENSFITPVEYYLLIDGSCKATIPLELSWDADKMQGKLASNPKCGISAMEFKLHKKIKEDVKASQ